MENGSKIIANFSIIISIVISVIGLYYAYQANQFSQKSILAADIANTIATQSNDVAQQAFKFNQKDRSSSIIDDEFNFLYYDAKNQSVMYKIKNNQIVTDKNDLLTVVDVFENLGIKYCAGLIDEENLRASFISSLIYICANDQIYDTYKGKKNATATLCYKFLPNEKFSSTLNKISLKTCKNSY